MSNEQTHTANAPNKFVNPYQGCRQTQAEDPRKLSCDIERGDFDYVKCLRTTQGTITTMACLLFKKGVDELKRRGCKDITDRAKFEHFIANCVLVLPGDVADGVGSSIGGSVKPSIGETNRGTVTRASATSASVSNERTNVSLATKQGTKSAAKRK